MLVIVQREAVKLRVEYHIRTLEMYVMLKSPGKLPEIILHIAVHRQNSRPLGKVCPTVRPIL